MRISIAILALLALFLAYRSWRAFDSLNWPRAEAEIVSCEERFHTERRKGHFEPTRGRRYWTVGAAFRPDHGDTRIARLAESLFPPSVGERRTIRYNLRDPGEVTWNGGSDDYVSRSVLYGLLALLPITLIIQIIHLKPKHLERIKAGVISELIGALEGSPVVEARRQSLDELGRIYSPEILAALVRLLDRPYEDLWPQSLRELRKRGWKPTTARHRVMAAFFRRDYQAAMEAGPECLFFFARLDLWPERKEYEIAAAGDIVAEAVRRYATEASTDVLRSVAELSAGAIHDLIEEIKFGLALPAEMEPERYENLFLKVREGIEAEFGVSPLSREDAIRARRQAVELMAASDPHYLRRLFFDDKTYLVDAVLIRYGSP